MYGNALQNRINSIVVKDLPGKTLYYAKILQDEFFYQYIRRNQQSLPYVRPSTAIPQEIAKFTDSRGYKRKVHKGSLLTNEGNLVHFDLWYTANNLPKFIKTFDQAVYAKIYEGTEGTFYRKITMGSKDNLLKFSQDRLEGALDLNKLLNPKLKVYTTDEFNKEGNLTTPTELEIGEEIYVHDVFNASPSKLTRYKVSAKRPSVGGKNQYKLTLIDELNLLNYELIEKEKKPLQMLQIAHSISIVSVSSAREAIKKARRSAHESALALVRTDQATSESSVLALDIKDVSDMSDEEVGTYTNKLRAQIRNLPTSTTIYIGQDLLAPLMDNFRGIAKILAEDLYAVTGFKFSIISEEVDDTLSEATKRLIKRGEILSAIITDPSIISKQGDDYVFSLRSKGKYSSMSRLSQGSIIAVGKDENNNEVYGYVMSVDDTTRQVAFKMFPQEVFDLLNSSIVPIQIFEQAVSDKLKC